jgi:hypothetical protein
VTGIKMTLGEFFKREELRATAQRAAEDADPEIQARKAAFEIENAILVAADKAFAIKNRLSIAYSAGQTAHANDDEREAPADLAADEAAEWLAGWDDAAVDAPGADDEGG